MEVRQLNTLIRAAQFQSFSKAAESLGYSQSAVTVQIKALEEELGVRLFDRMGKRVILTAQGQCFLEYANSILDTIHNARRALSGMPSWRAACTSARWNLSAFSVCPA